MRLDQNQFHGSIPPSYIGGGNCYSLRDLNLGENNLNASLVHNFDKNSSLSSSSICNLTSLDTLDLSENQMYGTLPQSCFGDSHQLAILNLRNNHFSGTLPPEFISDQLYMLDLNGNHFQGKIPRINSPKLTYLDLGNNQLNDTFPFFFSGDILSDLEILVLRSNKLYGPLHTRFAFNNLKVFDISSNYFTGALPLQFWLGLEAIKHINHTTDDKEESINYPPISSVIIYKGIETRLNRTFIDEFRAIDMSNNAALQGTIPESIGELLWLKMLNLSNNNLNGHIPSSLGNLIELESLDLSRNKLSGEIPRHLTDIHSLSVLNLSQNQLTGRIPDGAGQFSTFTNDSFIGNPGLCGSPLSIKCGDEAPPIQENESNEEDSNNPWNFGWEPVVVGYGCGILIGLVIQYFVFTKAFLYRWFG